MGSILVLARDAATGTVLLDALAAAGAGDGARSVSSAREALAAVLAPGTPPRLLILDAGASGRDLHALRRAASDPFAATRLVPLPPDWPRGAPDLAAVLAALSPEPPPPLAPARDAASLRRGLALGEIAVRFQPIVRIADRLPVAVEALARWDAPHAPLGPDDFVPLAERAGMGSALSAAVARRATAELAPLFGTLACRLAVNLPLRTLLDPASRDWLSRAARDAGLRPGALTLELTETTPVRDRALLRRALHRLRDAGLPVTLDDLCLDDGRDALLDLPFAGFKLDRSVVAAMPRSHRARREVARLVRLAERRGMTVTAEGVSGRASWRAVAAAGAHLAQGFAVGRPVMASLLPAWSRAWAQAWARPLSRGGYPG